MNPEMNESTIGTINDAESGSHLYVIGLRGGPFKIGISNNVAERRGLLNTGNHKHLHIYFDFDAGSTDRAKALERDLHCTFVKKHVRGEWFALSEDDLTTIRNTCKVSQFFEFPAPEEWSLDRVTCDPSVREVCQKARLALKLKVEEVANLAGLCTQTVTNFENNIGGPNQETVDSILDALKSKGAIFNWKEEKLCLTFRESKI